MANRRGESAQLNRKKKKQLKLEEKTYKSSLKEGKKYTKAQLMAKRRIAQKTAGTYQKPKTAQELAKDRLKIKADKLKKSTKKRNRVR
tara:strand:+ start:43 stop:306 length:264 start_codon:yes stop_codon:yes gene_type:complete